MFGQDISQLHPKESQQKEEEDAVEPVLNAWNFFEQSDFALNRQLPVQTFSSLHSFTPRELDFKDLSQIKLSEAYSHDKDCYRYIEEYDPFFLMPFQRGTSEAADVVEAKMLKQRPTFEVDCQKIHQNGQVQHEQTVLNTWESPVTSSFVRQELKSSYNARQTQKTIYKSQQNSTNKGFLTKNVSKNMGKLLLRFIWKKRQYLQQQMNIHTELWTSFLRLVVLWKKQNNITRQFFTSKWQGEGQEYHIFRMLSNHFFRKHCHEAILKSNIKEKQLHIEKISKFRSAISHPEALNSLA